MESTDSADMEMTRRGLRSFTRNFCNQSMQRLSKAISSTGMFSRREAEKMISDGRIKVNYNPISSVSQKVTEKDKIFVDDIELKSNVYTDRRPRLWIFNKVRGELVASHDAKNRPLIAKRIMKLVNEVGDLCPVNRLELNTEGLLLLTNNRILAQLMEHPDNSFVRKYRVRVHGKLTPSKLEGLQRGLHVKGVRYRPIVPVFERTTGVTSWMTLKCTENKTRFLRNCFEHLFLSITRVISTAHGPYNLPEDLPAGSYREVQLTPQLEKMLLQETNRRKKKLGTNTGGEQRTDKST